MRGDGALGAARGTGGGWEDGGLGWRDARLIGRPKAVSHSADACFASASVQVAMTSRHGRNDAKSRREGTHRWRLCGEPLCIPYQTEASPRRGHRRSRDASARPAVRRDFKGSARRPHTVYCFVCNFAGSRTATDAAQDDNACGLRVSKRENLFKATVERLGFLPQTACAPRARHDAAHESCAWPVQVSAQVAAVSPRRAT